MNLEIIKVGNGDKSYPGNFTKKEKHIIKEHIVIDKESIHLFSGRSIIGVDFSCKEANVNLDVFEYLSKYDKQNVGTVILDPPYNQRFADKYRKLGNTDKQFIIFANSKKTTELFNLIREKLNPDIIIIKSWNYYVPNDYQDCGSYLGYAGGYRKPTILMICSKVNKKMNSFLV